MAAVSLSDAKARSFPERLQMLAGFALLGSVSAGCLLSLAVLMGSRVDEGLAEVLHAAGAGLGLSLGAYLMALKTRATATDG